MKPEDIVAGYRDELEVPFAPGQVPAVLKVRRPASSFGAISI